MADKTSLGDRIKNQYERRTRYYLPRRTYTIIRLDGKAFHTYTKSMEKPFDTGFNDDIDAATCAIFREIQGAQFAYLQSDEISILLTDFEKDGTEAWFNGNIQKICSVSASMLTVNFNFLRLARLRRGQGWLEPISLKLAHFDSRVFTIPDRTEVENYFIWRQKDWTRNSVNMFARSFFSHKELNNKSVSDVHEMLYEKGENWADLDTKLKNGRIVKQLRPAAPIYTMGTKDPVSRVRSKVQAFTAPIFTEDGRNFFKWAIPTYEPSTT